MSRSSVVDSVRDRLLHRKRKTGENYEALLIRYALERLLYRLGQSDLRDQFVLKGAYSFLIWQGDLHRPTRDLDLLGYGSPEQLEEVFQRLCRMDDVPEDGVRFDAESVEVASIRDADAYGGMRVRLDATLGSAALRLQVDVGFGDAVVPPPEDTSFPTLLDFPAPEIRTYARPTVVAEKLHGLVTIGITNTRMERLLRPLVPEPHVRFRGIRSRRCHPVHLQAERDGATCVPPAGPVRDLRGGRAEATAVGCLPGPNAT